MIIVKLKGGLGNQLFQYALGRLLAIKNQTDLKLDVSSLGAQTDAYRSYGLDKFNINTPIASFEEIVKYKSHFGFLHKIYNKIFKNYHIGYEKNLLNTNSGYLEGFFQSYKYLEPIRTELLQEISLKENKHASLITEISQVYSVSIHIRRGDYVNDSKTKHDHFICDLAYYEQAIKLIKTKVAEPVFYIFSDDIIWAQANLKSDSKMIFVSGPTVKDYEELILMSKCRHNIIANSSFSFWGAWLNQNPEKIVIAPAKWNNKYNQAYKDLLPPTWLKIYVS